MNVGSERHDETAPPANANEESAAMGRRARRKRQTKEALIEAALRLFGAHGYTATTVRDITDAVDVAQGTFFNYFATKEDAVFADLEEELAQPLALLEQRPPSESTIDALSSWVLAPRDAGPTAEFERRHSLRMNIIGHTPELATAYRRRITAMNESVFARCYARDIGLPPDSREARMLAAITAAAFQAVAEDRFIAQASPNPFSEATRLEWVRLALDATRGAYISLLTTVASRRSSSEN